MLNNNDKALLIQIAREAINGFLTEGSFPAGDSDSVTDNITVNGGAFVSVYVEKELRGCIGTFSEEDPIWKSVRRMAIAAASNDTRFRPLTAEETEVYELEISVLSARKLIESVEEIEIGKHGIYIKSPSGRGTLLPQVAVKQGWTKEEFLGNCAKYKAGIGWNGWKQAEIYTYEAIVFDSWSE